MTILIQGIPLTIAGELREVPAYSPHGRAQLGIAHDVSGRRWSVRIVDVGYGKPTYLQATRIARFASQRIIISENRNTAYQMRDIHVFRLVDNSEENPEYVPCVACVMETRTEMPASYRITYSDNDAHCYCNRHANEIIVRCMVVAGDSVTIGERVLDVPLPYDIAADRAKFDRIWREGHEAKIKSQRERIMQFADSDGAAVARAASKPAKRKASKPATESDNFQWL